jgi:hypothetical protein
MKLIRIVGAKVALALLALAALYITAGAPGKYSRRLVQERIGTRSKRLMRRGDASLR